MMHHYTRDREPTLDRRNIDRTLTRNNYVVGLSREPDPETGERTVECEPVIQQEDDGICLPTGKDIEVGDIFELRRRRDMVQECMARKIRKDAVVMADLIVTVPDNVPPADEQTFFKLAYSYMMGVVGERNMLGEWVHLDEPGARHHGHIAFTTMQPNGRGGWTFNFKRTFSRAMYQRLHRDMADYMAETLGYTPHLELTTEEKAKRVYTERTADIDRMRGAVADLTREEVEKRRQAESERADAETAARAAKAEADTMRESAARETENMRTARAGARRAESELADLRRARTRTARQVLAVNDRIGEQRKRADSLDTEIASKTATLETVKTEAADTWKKVVSAKTEAADTLEKLTDAKKAYADTLAALGTAETALETTREKLASATEKLQTVNAEIAEKTENRDQVANEIADEIMLQAKLKPVKQELEEATAKRDAAKAEAADLRDDLAGAWAWTKQLEQAYRYAKSDTPPTFAGAAAQLADVSDNAIVSAVIHDDAWGSLVSQHLEMASRPGDMGERSRSLYAAIKDVVMRAVTAAIDAVRDVIGDIRRPSALSPEGNVVRTPRQQTTRQGIQSRQQTQAPRHRGRR